MTITPPPSLTLTPTVEFKPTPTLTPEPTYNLPAFECGIGGVIEALEWRGNVYRVILVCPNLRFKVGQGIGD